MRAHPILVSSVDHDRLRGLITVGSRPDDHVYREALRKELDRATVVPPDEVPADVVTMQSKLRVRVDGARRNMTFTLVYPDEADFDGDRISVLAPIGTALLGYRAGDEVEWDVPAGRRRFFVEKVLYQPEAEETGETGSAPRSRAHA